jgi:MFS family permease
MGQPTAGVAERRSPAGTEGAGRHPALALTALLGAMFLANVDVAIANVAAPSIKAGLHAGGGELELVVSGSTLAYAVLLVTSARLGEARGYRRVFLAGLGAFTVASAACGLAPDTPFLIAARIAAGAAAALMAAQVLTGIQRGFSGRARARAIGLYTLALSVGAVAGQSAGGLLISANVLGATWRPAFLVNVPCGVLLSLAASCAAFAGLWVLEGKVAARGGRPLVDPRLLARPQVGWGLAAQAAATATYFAIILAAGFTAIGVSLLAGPVSGTVLMTLLGIAGLGLGAEFTGMIGHLADSVTAEHAADVSGLFNTAARGGAVIGTAVFGTMYLALVRHPGQATHGFAVVSLALAGTALAAAAMAGVSVRRSR